MSDSVAGRKTDDGLAPPAKSKTDSQLRLVVEDDAVSFPDAAEPTDETPTMISKQAPAKGPTVARGPTVTSIKAGAAESLLQSLRGRQLAHYELIEPIGVGGMAAVLRARDTQLDRFVALKILPPDMARDDESIRRFHQEARSAAKLDHENIARVFFCGEDQGLHFIAFEFVEGENLRSILEHRGKLPVAEAVRCVLQIATGLEHAASRGVVHRDIKPSNIILTPTGRAKLVDMGLARSTAPQKEQLTQSGVTLGTFDYISPEQALEPREADARSDIYSLGCTFYHMLTGRPPVPEGTAAKKLHHHQHVMPIDPRQLNPDVPDDIALILARMMSKNPRERYQRPVHLVQHLVQVAQKVGAADNLPEGVLFVDAPLPTAPRKRPLLLVSVAALALATVLMLLSLAQPNKQTALRPGSKDASQKSTAKEPVPGQGAKQVNAVAPLLPRSNEVGSEEELRVLLESTGPNVQVVVTKDFDISQALVFQGDNKRQLSIEGKPDENHEPPTLRFTYHFPKIDQESLPDPAEIVAQLLLDNAHVTFQNLKFRLEIVESKDNPKDGVMAGANAPRVPVATVAVRGNSNVRFIKCWFAQVYWPRPPYINLRPKHFPIASVLVGQLPGRKSEKPRLEFSQCFFMGGQSAVAADGSADLFASNCAFQSHGALFHLRGHGSAHVKLDHCSALVVNGPALRIDDDVACQFTVEHSIFSCTDDTLTKSDEPHLIRHTDTKAPKLAFKGLRNYYDKLNAFWVWPADGPAHILTNYHDFQNAIAAGGGADSNSTVNTDPAVKVWRNPNPARDYFVIDAKNRDLRTLPDLKRPLGIEKCAWGDMPALEPLKDEVRVADLKLQPHEKLVDPTTDNKTLGVYETITQALANAKPGDVILIKHGPNSREVEVESTLLNKPKIDVTLRPYDEASPPILTLAETRDPNANFFRLHDGRIMFERLEIVLDPDQRFQSQSFVQLDGNASVTFRNCVITLRQNPKINPGKSIPLTVVMLPESDEAMMMMGARPLRSFAEAVFQSCFVRGEGEVISNRAGRALDVQIDNTLVGLVGPFLSAQGGGKEAAMDSAVTLRLNKSSFFLSEPFLVARQGKHAKGLPPIKVERARDCLFVPLEQKPFINLELPDLSDTTLRSVFDWNTDGRKGGNNAYNGFETLLDDGQLGFRLAPLRWKEMFYKDSELRFTSAAFVLPAAARQLWLTTPEAYKPRAEYQSELEPYGAILEADQLPAIPKKGD
jgi:serine/threonine protein kinase